MSSSVVYLSCAGPIQRGPTLFYGGKDKTMPCCRFSVPYKFLEHGKAVEIWFIFMAFDRLAEYIALHYKRGQEIHILRARPARQKQISQQGYIRFFRTWVIDELGRPKPRPGAHLPQINEIVLEKSGDLSEDKRDAEPSGA